MTEVLIWGSSSTSVNKTIQIDYSGSYIVNEKQVFNRPETVE